jgi:hypothetical protein
VTKYALCDGTGFINERAKRMTPTSSILNHIRSLGYAVSAHMVNGTVELHTVKLDCSVPPQVARVADGDGPDEQYRCACLLARAIGIELDDG